jgi:DNA-binding transcriptional MocR family regulator
MALDQLISVANLDRGDKPKYQAIADDLVAAIRSGQLAPGEKLPPQRSLAARLQVTTGTVSRAYARLEHLGLASARVGDGTYVRTLEAATVAAARDSTAAPVNLANNVAIATGETQALMRAFAEISADPGAMRQVLNYQHELGSQRHREAGTKWLRRFGTGGDVHRVMVTHGAQHGLACVLRTLARPGDAVLTEALSYPGLLALARSMRLQLIGVETDDEGLLPTALEKAAVTFSAKLLFCTPTLHNPTTSTMSQRRREDVAVVARRCGLLVIEDAVHAATLASPPPALSVLLPAHSFLLSSLSKAMAPGLRVGYIETDAGWLTKLAGSMRADCWMVAPLMPEIATRWLESGWVDELLEQQRRCINERLLAARQRLAGLEFSSRDDHPLIWLPLPEPWRAGPLSSALRAAGVLVRTADHFAVGRGAAPNAIRLSVNAAESLAQLERGLEIFRATIVGESQVAARNAAHDADQGRTPHNQDNLST